MFHWRPHAAAPAASEHVGEDILSHVHAPSHPSAATHPCRPHAVAIRTPSNALTPEQLAEATQRLDDKRILLRGVGRQVFCLARGARTRRRGGVGGLRTSCLIGGLRARPAYTSNCICCMRSPGQRTQPALRLRQLALRPPPDPVARFVRSFSIKACGLLQQATLHNLLVHLRPEQLSELHLTTVALSADTIDALAALTALRHLRCCAKSLPDGIVACIAAHLPQVSREAREGIRHVSGCTAAQLYSGVLARCRWRLAGLRAATMPAS